MTAELDAREPVGLKWHKSSYSGSGGGNCVEAAVALGTVHVRDSKDQSGPILSFSVAQWTAFTTYARVTSI
ncbi:DUF397 domain-containing protein [Streptomyces sp. NPDC021080]|uniref:DUF397 domain-containing protein n=1 Tax=Streptomyces sp. NPDC021080 TaxID=3365110 RepID=UPI0037A48B35